MSITINEKLFSWNVSEQAFQPIETLVFPNDLPKEDFPFDPGYWERRTN